jgi:PKD repeat protein
MMMRAGTLLFAVSAAAVLVSGCGGGAAKNARPTAAFTVSCTDLRCSFVDASSDADGSIGSRSWDFGDHDASTDVSPTHTYAAPGAFTVTLTVTDDRGATGSISRQVTMNLPPRASFDVSCSGLTCTMVDGSTDVAGSIVSRSWNFGDGSVSVEPNPSHTYVSSGTPSVTLTVTDDGGVSDTTTRSISVSAEPVGTPPVAAFAVTCSSVTCTFTDQSTDADGTVTAWSWSFGDGAVSTDRNPQHTYGVAALTEFTVQLTVTDNDGASAIISRSFTVSPPAALQCHDAANTGELVGCTMTLDRAARIEVELTNRECGALGNTFTVTSPVVTTLFTNGCYDPPVGTVFTLSDNGNPFPAGTVIAAQMTSGSVKQEIPPSLIVTGSASPWQLQFDDGEVAPRDLDIVLTIRAVP